MSLKEKSCINDQKKQNELNYKKDELDYVFEKLMVSPIQNHKRLQNEIRYMKLFISCILYKYYITI